MVVGGEGKKNAGGVIVGWLVCGAAAGAAGQGRDERQRGRRSEEEE